MPSTRDSAIVARSEVASERRDRKIGYRQAELPLVTRTFGGLRSVSSITDFRVTGPNLWASVRPHHAQRETQVNELEPKLEVPSAAQRTLWRSLQESPLRVTSMTPEEDPEGNQRVGFTAHETFAAQRSFAE